MPPGASQMPPGCLPDASRCFPDASQMPPRCLPDASRCLKMPPDAFQMPPRRLQMHPRCLQIMGRHLYVGQRSHWHHYYERSPGPALTTPLGSSCLPAAFTDAGIAPRDMRLRYACGRWQLCDPGYAHWTCLGRSMSSIINRHGYRPPPVDNFE